MAAPLLVVDLSHHNPEPNWTQLRAGGVVGVIMKASEGQTFIDKTFTKRRQAALSAGLKVSSYHFFHGNAQAEMAHYLATVQPRQGERVCIDHEAKATLQQLIDAVRYIRETRPDLQITIYSGHLIKEQIGGEYVGALAANSSLWIAHYTSATAPSWPKATWPSWSLWQYTDKANAPGISKPVDGNRFNGSAENCALWFGPITAPPPRPEPQPEPEPPSTPAVIVSVQASANVALQLVVNGRIVKVPPL